ncbi:MAG: HIT family protein [Candidatus Paceibacterota bacterium]|jgi:diadenosine tetraphosphate (Ap4A) HIT family hydrolase|nr:HIT family protein [Candidatus Paceibacterota bacterium]
MKQYTYSMENNCIFCKIASKKIETPGVFWEDDEFMAFLSIDPNTKGFSVVIPKEHYPSDFLKIPDDILQRLIIAAKKAASILEKYFDDAGRIGLIIEGMGVNHAHIKLVPMHGTESFKKGEWRQTLSGKEFWFDKYEGWLCSGSGPAADPKDLKQLAEELRKIK